MSSEMFSQLFMQKHKILILGPQGSGKGTQAEILAKKLGVPALSMGQLLRDVQASGSDLGKEAATFLDKGILVPDRITSAVFKKRLELPDVESGFIIDSFPRFMEQYASSKSFFQPTAVIVLSVPEEESLRRIAKRAEIENRVDDTPEAIRARLTWSREQTQPVIDEYISQGVAHVIDGVGTVEEIASRIDGALGM
jgi:adenylate kinase